MSITVLLTALYTEARQLDVVQAALRGVVPATVGLGLLLTAQIARPLLSESNAEGWVSLLLSCLLLAGSGAAVLALGLPVIAVLIGAALLSALYGWWRSRGDGAPR